jgi:hypothetical protein
VEVKMSRWLVASVCAAVAVIVMSPVRAVGQSPPNAGGQALTKEQQEAREKQRQLLLEVAESLKKKESATAPGAVPKNWKPARTPWGDPDLSGIYSNSDESGIPFEKPAEFEGRRLEDIAGAELTRLQEARRAATLDLASRLSEDPNPQLFWWETLNAKNSRPWLVVDPPDGKIPPQTPEAVQRAAARAEARRTSGRGPADAPEDRSLYDRCISRGLPGSMIPAIYGSSYEIVQGQGYVGIIYEMIHETRVIPTDTHPHVGKRIQTYMGDPRGHWDGNTLVVETTNFKDQTAYRGANGATLRLIERFTPIGPNTVEWSVTVDDQATWTRPWTFAMNLSKKDETQRPFEYGCHEGNYGLRNILSAARAEDRAAAAAAARQAEGGK